MSISKNYYVSRGEYYSISCLSLLNRPTSHRQNHYLRLPLPINHWGTLRKSPPVHPGLHHRFSRYRFCQLLWSTLSKISRPDYFWTLCQATTRKPQLYNSLVKRGNRVQSWPRLGKNMPKTWTHERRNFTSS